MTNPVHNQHVSQGSTLGLSLMDGGGVFNAWSATAETMKLLILDSEDSSKVLHEILLEAQDDGIFSGAHDGLLPGTNYVLRADGPKGQRHAFDPTRNLLDPYAKGLVRQSPSDYYCVAVQDDFDWQGVSKPGTKLAESVIYEAHLRGLTRLNPQIPEEIRGSYAALGHPATIDYLTRLGITAIELLWELLNKRWMYFFFGLAILNECVWRTQTAEFWVNFKVWGMLPITLVFTGFQISLINKHKLDE